MRVLGPGFSNADYAHVSGLHQGRPPGPARDGDDISGNARGVGMWYLFLGWGLKRLFQNQWIVVGSSSIMDSSYGYITGGIFSAEKNLTRGLCLTKSPHPRGEIVNFVHAFYDPPGRPGARPLRRADDRCFTLVRHYTILNLDFCPSKSNELDRKQTQD